MADGQHVCSASGIPIKNIYTPEDTKDIDYDRDLGLAGQPPFTRGVYPTMYRGRLWTIRRLSGFNTPEETNKLYREEYELGQTGFSVAPDVSTVVGLDADDPWVTADIGHAGVPMSSLEDVQATFEGLPIEKVSTYMADRCGAVNTAMYFVMAEERGLDLQEIRGTTANDLLSWSVPALINQPPPQAYVRYAVDFIEWCTEHAPKWNPVSFDSYNARDCGLNAVQELGMLMATAIQYIEEEKKRGRVSLDRFVRRFSFNTGLHNDFFEEIAKLRAARRMWHRVIRERYGIEDPRCALFRVHVQSSGSTHTTQEPLNNVIRIAYQVLAGVLGGAQSIHANGYDEGVCLPTDQSMLLSIRTEQIAALETNVTNTIDPVGGSYYVESLTNQIEERAWQYVQKIEDMGGMAEAIACGWVHREYMDATIEHERRLASGDITIVGVNKFRMEKEPYEVPIFRWDPEAPDKQIERLKKFKKNRDQSRVNQALQELERVTRSGENVYPAVMEAVRAGGTLGEIAGVQHKVYGVWHHPIGV
ncbi:MAG: methylmalonyl-CoA mutase [Chloroflexi bacterium]|nr:MAG: methylmalonyl-CoA mutase [Chloroflexota bacterium]